MSFNNNCQRLLRRLKIVRVRSRAQENSADIAALTSCRFERAQSTFLKVVLPIHYYLCRFRMLRNFTILRRKPAAIKRRAPSKIRTRNIRTYMYSYAYNIHASDVFNMTACIDRF